MNDAFLPPILRGLYGRNVTHTKAAKKGRASSMMLTWQQRHSGSYGTGRASSSRSYSQEMSPSMTCDVGTRARSIMAKHTFLSIDSISGGMVSMLLPLGKGGKVGVRSRV